MPWWQIALLVYFIPFPLPQIATWAACMVIYDDWKHRRKDH